MKLSDCRIVVSVTADAATRFAAAELAKYLEKITGKAIPTVTDATPAQAGELCVGEVAREGCPCVCGLKNDGFALKTLGDTLFIRGMNSRGNAFGVYRFLENALGCRFYTDEVEKVPCCADMALPTVDESLSSPFEYRMTSWHAISHYPAFSLKRGFNSQRGTGCEPILSHSLCHTLFSFVSPQDYFDEHPEYFSMVNGKRIREETQLCLTNPEVLEITKKKLRQTILDHPDCKIFSVSQMDWYNPCECPECAKIDAEEGSHMGTVLRFVNACADAMAEEFPDVIIETLAYQYTRTPPKITKPRPNVCICLCTIECCFTHPMRECREPVRPFKYLIDPDHPIQDDLEGWSKICDRLMIWDYTTNYRFYLTPMVNLHVLQSNIQYFIENGVKLLFEQGNGQSLSGEFGELRAYLISKLMWEPDGDVNAWMGDFLTGYYGAGGVAIRKYIDLLVDHVTRHRVHAGIYDNPMDVIPNTMMPALTACWDEAARLSAGDPAAADRVDRSRLQLEFAKHHRRRTCEVDFAEEAEKLCAKIRQHNITYVQEIFESQATQQEALDRSLTQIRKGNLPDTWEVFWRPF